MIRVIQVLIRGQSGCPPDFSKVSRDVDIFVTSHRLLALLSNYECEVTSSTTMASPPLGKESNGLLKAPRRVFNRVRDRISRNSSSLSPALPETSASNIPNDDPGVVRDRSYASSDRSSGIDSADKVGETPDVDGNRSQDAIPSSEQSSSHPESNTADKIKKAWGVTRSALVTALRLLEKSGDAFPPLKSAVGGLVACLDLAQVS